MEGITEFPDKDYNVISVLYHSLKGADNCEIYKGDANKENDRELVEFFDEARKRYMELADKAKKLTSKRIS